MNANEITLSENPETVSVGEFRNRISHLERLVMVDLPACGRRPHERANWARIARRIGGELIATTCKRATAEDWARRERIIDRSADRIIAITVTP